MQIANAKTRQFLIEGLPFKNNGVFKIVYMFIN